ncbi:hypothetical protein RI367_000283 [Sorochytrium milnesiophthora]
MLSAQSSQTRESLEQMNLSREEVDRLQTAFKDPQFKSLFQDYLQEISDPASKKLYEEEITALERERGNQVRFIKPEGAFVVKTSWSGADGKSATAAKLDTDKVFVNIASSPEVERPSSEAKRHGSKVGQSWKLPHTMTHERTDADHAGKTCAVYDVVYHPECIAMALPQSKFREMVISSALESLEKQFSIRLSRDYRVLNIKYKGTPPQTVLRDPIKQEPSKDQDASANGDKEPREDSSSLAFLNNLLDQSKSQVSHTKTTTAPLVEELIDNAAQPKPAEIKVPRYTIVHRDHIQLNDYTNERKRHGTSRPDALIVKFQLPAVASATEVDLTTAERSLTVSVPNKYFGTVDLPFPVNDAEGKARFDKHKRTLELTLPVIQAQPEPDPDAADVPLEPDEPDTVLDEAEDAATGQGSAAETTSDKVATAEPLTPSNSAPTVADEPRELSTADDQRTPPLPSASEGQQASQIVLPVEAHPPAAHLSASDRQNATLAAAAEPAVNKPELPANVAAQLASMRLSNDVMFELDD